MSWIMVDVESDGPIPGDNSMIAFGAVVVEPSLSRTFLGRLKPISNTWIPEALAVSGYSREDTESFDDPVNIMNNFKNWLQKNSNGRPMFISDNNGYDFMFMHWYFIHFCGTDPFGHSSTNLGSLYKGCVKDMRKNFKHLRKTKHDHNPVNDALGNAEAFIEINKRFNLNIKFD